MTDPLDKTDSAAATSVQVATTTVLVAAASVLAEAGGTPKGGNVQDHGGQADHVEAGRVQLPSIDAGQQRAHVSWPSKA